MPFGLRRLLTKPATFATGFRQTTVGQNAVAGPHMDEDLRQTWGADGGHCEHGLFGGRLKHGLTDVGNCHASLLRFEEVSRAVVGRDIAERALSPGGSKRVPSWLAGRVCAK